MRMRGSHKGQEQDMRSGRHKDVLAVALQPSRKYPQTRSPGSCCSMQGLAQDVSWTGPNWMRTALYMLPLSSLSYPSDKEHHFSAQMSSGHYSSARVRIIILCAPSCKVYAQLLCAADSIK